MGHTNLASAVAYYTAMHNKDLAGVGQCLHPNVHFQGPLANLAGKELVLEAAKHFMSAFKSLTIRAKFESENQVMLAYDLDCPEPIGLFRAAALMTFTDGLISRLELFYDARPFEAKQKEIFSSSTKDQIR